MLKFIVQISKHYSSQWSTSGWRASERKKAVITIQRAVSSWDEKFIWGDVWVKTNGIEGVVKPHGLFIGMALFAW